MPLLIEFRAGDKLIINGSVIENSGHNTRILVHNESAILREREVLAIEDAQTPASRVYFEIQAAYIVLDEEKRQGHLKMADTRLNEFAAACPGALDIVQKIRADLQSNRLYKSLKSAQKLIRYEANILNELSIGLQSFLDSNPDEDGAAVSTTVVDETDTAALLPPQGD